MLMTNTVIRRHISQAPFERTVFQIKGPVYCIAHEHDDIVTGGYRWTGHLSVDNTSARIHHYLCPFSHPSAETSATIKATRLQRVTY